MPQLRYDPTTADWVVFAPLRKLRPRTLSVAPDVVKSNNDTGNSLCPFCPSNENMTPGEIDRIRPSGGQSEWLVRVIPNKFPALRIEEDNRRQASGELFEQMGGCGAHEVVIESPQHDVILASQDIDQISRVLTMLRRRYVDLMRDQRMQSVIIFKNHGIGAGTSLAHPHWQIIATSVVPRTLRLKYMEATDYMDRTGVCLYEALLQEEVKRRERIVGMNDEFIAMVPFAARLPFETWIVPRRPQASFSLIQDGQIGPLASLLKELLLTMYVGLENPDYNLTIDTASRGEEDEPFFRWHIRILPRLATAAGFELGSGMSINTVMPEEAARYLTEGNHIGQT